jgi:two-component system, LytTR family, sensor kinase
MAWFAYIVAWLAAAVFWSMAAASGTRSSPLEALPYGLITMASAALMGVGVWRLTDRVRWDWRSPAFYAVHAAGLVMYASVYASSMVFTDVFSGRFAAAAAGLRSSPVLVWSLLMGSWLYLMVAGLSYSIRAHRRVRDEEAAAAEARVLAQQAQLVALRAQINPHFLFNALHSVGALVASDPARADMAIECLGDLLRYALGTESEVLFAQEWKFTENYLAFEQLRLGDRLAVDAAADDRAMAVMVPPLILQPLVENAVRHGIADRAEGGRIELRALAQEGRLMLRVTDDGKGSAEEARDGLGLSSVRRRLAALYGDRAAVSVVSSTAGFTVTVALPLMPENGLGSAA